MSDLEPLRSELGLSKKALADLLGVDPSAVTRWTRPGARPPEPIRRALGWYLQLQALKAMAGSSGPSPAAELKIKNLQTDLERLRRELAETSRKLSSPVRGLPLDWAEEKASLVERIEHGQGISTGWKLLLLLNILILIFFVLGSLF